MKTAEEIARQLTKQIAKSAFKFYRDKEVRNQINFETIKQVEQDRIFNEIVVAGLGLAILMFKSLADIKNDDKLINFYNELAVETASSYGNWLIEMGTEEKFAKIWKQLIEMRCSECEKDFLENRKHFPDPNKSNPWIAVVAINCHSHIRRGKGEPEDPLFLMTVRWVKQTAILISKTLIR